MLPRKFLWRGGVAAIVGAVAVVALAASAPSGYRPANGEIEHEVRTPNRHATSGSCGVERWAVKTGTDADARRVHPDAPVVQTIAYLASLAPPAHPPAHARVQPAETTTYVLDATLVEYKLDADSDYQLIIRDAHGNTMIAEIPDPACVKASSPFASRIDNARAGFNARFTATTGFKTANIPVRLTGVGFFDYRRGQPGVAPNAIELHPVLDVDFNPSAGRSAAGQ